MIATQEIYQRSNTVHHPISFATILIIEDDEEILELETFHLEKEGYKVLPFHSTKNVEQLLENESIDLMLIDRKLPGIEGADFVRYIRDKGFEIPIMFVSGKSKDTDVVEGYMSGCDDYLRKPFHIQEFLCRIKAILRRTNVAEPEHLNYRDIKMDLSQRKVYIDKEEISLTKLEFNLLKFFIAHQNRILDREYLLRHVWGEDALKQKRTVNVTLNRLKKKIDPTGSKEYITAIHGIGYKLS